MSQHDAAQRMPTVGSLGPLIRSELAPFPGRLRSVARLVLSMALVIVIAMTLQLPFLSLSMVMVLFTAQESTLLTRLAGTTLLIGTTLAVALGLLLIKFTIDYPMIRILTACVVASAAMYFMRISRLGAIGYLVALFVFYLQSFVDLGIGPEALLRSLLWLWVAITYPIVLTIAVNHLVLPQQPARMLRDEMARQLGEVLLHLQGHRLDYHTQALPAAAVGRSALALHRHLTLAAKDTPAHRHNRAIHSGRAAALGRLHTAAAHLSRLPKSTLSPAQTIFIAMLEADIRAFQSAIVRSTRFVCLVDPCIVESPGIPLDALLREMALALEMAATAETAEQVPPPGAEPLFAQDALTNPVYAQFALKTVLAATICYFVYTALDWPGIHTSMLTCFILALPSLGAASHKGLQRIIGCVLGSVVALVATVFVIPHLDTIVGLLLLTLPIVAAGAWVAAGSPRSNYIGVQFVFAFALAQLGHFGPYSDISEIRDRMVGIMVGVAVSVAVSATLWPEREMDSLAGTLRRAMRGLAGLIGADRDTGNRLERQLAMGTARLQAWASVAQVRDVHQRASLEPGRHGGVVMVRTAGALAQAPDVILAVCWLQVLAMDAGTRVHGVVSETLDTVLARVGERLEQLSGVSGPATDGRAGGGTGTLDELDLSKGQEGPEASWIAEIVSTARDLGKRLACLDTVPADAHDSGSELEYA